jgi:GDP-4-dehydro-6-deoxy-D-mannose reductase
MVRGMFYSQRIKAVLCRNLLAEAYQMDILKDGVFITGGAGFVGAHLIRYLAALGGPIYGFDLRPSALPAESFLGDMSDRAALTGALKAARPAVVCHLAGLLKSDCPEPIYSVHVLGTVNLFESILEAGISPLVLIASSSGVYGPGNSSRPIGERAKLAPVTHYGVSKMMEEAAALRYARALSMNIVIARTFNLLGPGMPPTLACSDFARQIARAERDNGDHVVVGNLSPRRDFLDVRDAVSAYADMLRKGRSGEVYNVGSGKSVSIRTCLNRLLEFSKRDLLVSQDPARKQKNDIFTQASDTQKLFRRTGWKPKIPLRQSLLDLLNDWRKRVREETE